MDNEIFYSLSVCTGFLLLIFLGCIIDYCYGENIIRNDYQQPESGEYGDL